MNRTAYLCDNPSCVRHCRIHQVRSQATGKDEWRFVDGFATAIDKHHLREFDPAARFNLCGSCRRCYRHMLERMREICHRRLSRQPAEIAAPGVLTPGAAA
jgi:hypothetical protein